MSAGEKIISRIGILAGGGAVPVAVAEACRANGIEVFVAGFEGHVQAGLADALIRLGAVGKTLKILRQAGVRDLVLIGSLGKPSLASLRPDLKAMQFLLKHGYESLGDDGLLRALRHFLEDEGFRVHGVHTVVPELLTPAGVLGGVSPAGHEADLRLGMEAARAHGAADQGQSVLVLGGEVIAREARAGTDAMIRAYGRAGAVLVKMCKPQQDKDLDLPTIGLETVRAGVQAGLAGIAAEAGASLFVQREEALKLADETGIFVAGVK